ncbi:Cof-type HAD-IIB family hydrolase [Halobacillus yeomjeoni]|uniref:HAD family phosphatase n=1 Tax=Halobacillus yeomjeoni TaxID=311194 RepID=A0A931HRZ7_9BACI|nr:Cof-type HAD-IIB family hydrolase [Halobacillus yeomjeoni]MBH0228770.1 HAD family phosphatase [Halobacillus yeomjeoni]
MNEQHLIALDLDGTLLTDDKVISERTKKTVLQAMQQGHIVVIATGRPHRASIDFYEELGLDTPMVNFNGALIHHPKDHRWNAIHSPIGIRTAHKIIHVCHELGVKNILAEVKDQVYLDQYDDEIMKIFQGKDDSPITVGRLQSNLKDDPTSLLIHPEEDKIKKLRERLDEEASLIEHRKWGAPWHVIEIVRAGMNKAVGLDKIARYFHIPKSRVIAFGDEDNDLEMLDYAGVGVAMGNAIDELKAVAKHVTGTNEEDGIDAFLTDYLNLNKKAM